MKQATVKQQPTFRQRMGYWFDNTMSRGTPALIGWLGVVSAAMVLLFTLVLVILPLAPAGETGEPRNFIDLVWSNFKHAFDPGELGGDTGDWPFLILMLLLTLGGIFILSTLIGVLTSGVESKLEELRKGRSLVLENNHIIVLGWSDQVFTILSELAIANANQKNPCVVILADKDKVEMEDEIRDKLNGKLGKLRVICRTGKPIDLVDLNIVNPQGSRSIIVLSPSVEEPDAEVIKTILAITNNPKRRTAPYHIVGQIRDPKNMEAARLVGNNEAQLIDVGDAISRLTAQTSRQSGLSVVYTELLDFGGDEIYFQEEPALVGKTFGHAILAYEDSTIIGLQFADGRVALNPPMDTLISQGDKVIAISEDDDTVKVSGMADLGINEEAIRDSVQSEPAPERALLLGWNWRGTTIINELDNYVPSGSEVTVAAMVDGVEEEIEKHCSNLHNVTVTFRHGDTTDRGTLNALEIPSYNHVMVLSYSDNLDAQHADSRTLITLLHLRDIRNKSNTQFSIVSEMEDINNKELAEVTQADDFILSDTVISLMLSQISENKYLTEVFTDLFRPEGSEIYLKPVSDYIALDQPVNFYTVVEAARRCDQVAIGYRLMSESKDAEKSYGVAVNPEKSKQVRFSLADRVIVLAEN